MSFSKLAVAVCAVALLSVQAAVAQGADDFTEYTDGSIPGKTRDDEAEYMASFDGDNTCLNANELGFDCLDEAGEVVSRCFSEIGEGVGKVAWANYWLGQAGSEEIMSDIVAPKYARFVDEYCVSLKVTGDTADEECQSFTDCSE